MQQSRHRVGTEASSQSVNVRLMRKKGEAQAGTFRKAHARQHFPRAEAGHSLAAAL